MNEIERVQINGVQLQNAIMTKQLQLLEQDEILKKVNTLTELHDKTTDVTLKKRIKETIKNTIEWHLKGVEEDLERDKAYVERQKTAADEQKKIDKSK